VPDCFRCSQKGFAIGPASPDPRTRVWKEGNARAPDDLPLSRCPCLFLLMLYLAESIHHLHSWTFITAFLLLAYGPACHREQLPNHLSSVIIHKAFVQSMRRDNPLNATPVTLIIRLCYPIPQTAWPTDPVCRECDRRGSQLLCYIVLMCLAKTKWHLTKRSWTERNGQMWNDSLCLMVDAI